MPIRLQFYAAVIAAVTCAVMGKAFIPFMKKQRFCEEESPQNADEAVKPLLLPTMGGLLAVFGCILGFVPSYLLYRASVVYDRTSVSVQTDARELIAAIIFVLIWTILGVLADLYVIRRKPLKAQPLILRIAFVYVTVLLFLMLGGSGQAYLDFGFFRYHAGILGMLLTAAIGTGLFLLSDAHGAKIDGMQISVGGILCLGMAVLLLQEEKYPFALLALAAAGACMGCFVWNLHPAKCRLGKTGAFWNSAMLTALCLLTHQHTAMLLALAVYLMDVLPCVRKSGASLQKQMQTAGIKPWQSIAVFAGFACFCSITAIMLYAAF